MSQSDCVGGVSQQLPVHVFFFFFFEDWRLHGKFMFVLNWFSHLALYTCLGGGNPPTDLLFAPVLPGCDFHFTSKVKISFPRQKDWRVLMQRGGAIGGNQSKLPANLGAVNFPTTTTVGFPPVWNSNYFGTEFCHSWRWNDIRRMFSFLTNLDKSGSSRQLCNYVFTLSAPPPNDDLQWVGCLHGNIHSCINEFRGKESQSNDMSSHLSRLRWALKVGTWRAMLAQSVYSCYCKVM